MEALGVASSIAGLISLTDVIAFKISRYYSLVKSAKSDIKDLLVEVQSLYGVLNSLKLLATCIEDNEQSTGTKKFPQLDHFQTCRQNLDELRKSLNTLDLDSLKGVAAAKAKLLWPFKAAETKELVAKISRNKRDLSDALTADSLTALINALSSQARLTEAVEKVELQIQRVIEEKAENEEDEQRKKIFDWCSEINPYQKHRNAKSLRHPNTVLWFFDCPEYRKWVEEENSAIWLFGIPGAGKTILASAVIEEAKILTNKNPQITIAYYYCEYKLPDTQILTNILGSLVRQISASSDDAFELLEEFYEAHNIKGRDPVLPTEEELESLLKSLSQLFDSVMIIIDGLDECSKPEERSKILDLLSVLNNPGHGTIKTIYTSRDEIDIRRAFSNFGSISIAARGNDLELYVAAVIETRLKNKTMRMKDPALKESIINGLVSKANGMFQWAKCQLDHLCLLSTDKERRRALESLPKDLFETYKRILERVNHSTEGNQRLVEKTLRWLTFGNATFDVRTICTAVAIENGSSFIDPDNVPDEDSILWWCSSLVSKDEKTGTIAFSHFTVREFLVDKNILNFDNLSRYHMDVHKSGYILSKLSLTYLLSKEFSQLSWTSRDGFEQIVKQYPLLDIVTFLWPSPNNIDEADDEVFQLLCSLLDPIKTQNFIMWLEIFYPRIFGSAVHITASPLHIAAAFGLWRVCKWLLEKGVDFNQVDQEIGTPLMCALAPVILHRGPVIWPRLEVVRLFLKHKVKWDAELVKRLASDPQIVHVYNPMTNLLGFALDKSDLCRILFMELLDFNAISSFSGSQFWKYNLQSDDDRLPGLLDMFKEIMCHPSSVRIDLESRKHIISFIARYEPTKETGPEDGLLNESDLSAFNGDADVILSVARRGKTKLLESLLDKGSDQDTISSCLQSAACDGYRDMLEMLLYHPICRESLAVQDVQAAWIGSVRAEQVECLEIFIKYGIEVNIIVPQRVDDRNELLIEGSALVHAVLSGHLGVVQFLLTVPGIDCSVTTSTNFNLLHFAAQAPRHRLYLIKMLIDMGLDPLQIAKGGKSVLHTLCENEYPLGKSDIEVVELLVRGGCKFDTFDSKGETPLHSVLRRPDLEYMDCLEAMLGFLNPSGMLTSTPTRDGILPLQLAVRGRASSAALRKLIPSDISLWNSSKCRKSSALHDALTIRMHPRPPPPPPPNRIWIRPGLPPPPPPPPVPTPAARQLNDTKHMLRILRLLLENSGVNINVVDEHGNTPLISFSKSCYSPFYGPKVEILKELIIQGANIKAINSTKWSALHYFASFGFIDGLSEVFKTDFDLHILNANGFSPIHQAIFEGTISTVRFWLIQAASSNQNSKKFSESFEQPTARGLFPVHLAALLGHTDIVDSLHSMDRLKDINIPTITDKVTPLHLAASKNRTAVMELLILYGANVNAVGIRKATPLHFAAENGSVAAAHLLKKHGANLDLEDCLGQKPWMSAEIHKYEQLKIALQAPNRQARKPKKSLAVQEETAPTPELNKQSDYTSDSESDSDSSLGDSDDRYFSEALRAKLRISTRQESFLDALSSGNIDVCRDFLEAGMDTNDPVNDKGQTPLHVASYGGSVEVVRLLIQFGADISARDPEGDAQPIHFAANNNCHKIVKTLLDHGALPTSRNIDMQTPMHLAANNGYINVLKVLLSHSTATIRKQQIHQKSTLDPLSLLEMRDCDGLTAFLSAIDGKHIGTAEFLMRQGADVMAKDLQDRDAFWYAGFPANALQPFFQRLIDRGLKPKSHPFGYTGLCSLAYRKPQNAEQSKIITETTLLLIEAGASLDSDNFYKESVLHCACIAGNEILVTKLLKRMPKHELDVESNSYGTPIFAAAFRGRLPVVKILIEAGADINLGLRGETPLAAAVAEGHTEIAELLQAHKAMWKD